MKLNNRPRHVLSAYKSSFLETYSLMAKHFSMIYTNHIKSSTKIKTDVKIKIRIQNENQFCCHKSAQAAEKGSTGYAVRCVMQKKDLWRAVCAGLD